MVLCTKNSHISPLSTLIMLNSLFQAGYCGFKKELCKWALFWLVVVFCIFSPDWNTAYNFSLSGWCQSAIGGAIGYMQMCMTSFYDIIEIMTTKGAAFSNSFHIWTMYGLLSVCLLTLMTFTFIIFIKSSFLKTWGF